MTDDGLAMSHRTLACALTALMLAVAPTAAAAAPAREDVRDERRRTATELRQLLREIEGIQAVTVAGEDEITRLRTRARQLASEQTTLQRDVNELVRTAVMYGGLSDTVAMLSSSGPDQAVERAQFVATLARRNTAAGEEIAAAQRQQGRLIELIGARVTELGERRRELKQASAKVSDRLDELRVIERRLEERARRRRAARQSGSTPATASAAGGYACIQAQPYSFIDSWGFPRSGGRAHQGTDVMASYGNEVYAFTAGRISRMSTGGLGGITLWLNGDDGISYYYAHLSGYAAGISEGTTVRAGQLIASNGNSGNAAGTPPHVHFEAHPGGGGAINPYPTLRAACP